MSDVKKIEMDPEDAQLIIDMAVQITELSKAVLSQNERIKALEKKLEWVKG